MSAPTLERHCGSWIIVSRSSGLPVLETFSQKLTYAVNTRNYEVLTALQWLARFQRQINAKKIPA